MEETTHDDIFTLSPQIRIVPLLHGSGDMAQEVREALIQHPYDCLAVPLPPSAEPVLEAAIEDLPSIHVVLYSEPDQDDHPVANFIPVDPCQPVIMGIRVARGEGIPRAYIDREVTQFAPTAFTSPDPYAMKRVPMAAFCAALIPSIPPPSPGSQQEARLRWMAFRLHELELDYQAILCLCHIADWPWLRQAYRERTPFSPPEPLKAVPQVFSVSPQTLYFVLGELPFVTQVYEQRRAQVRADTHVSVDGIKELLLETRTHWLAVRHQESLALANWVTPHLLQVLLQYVRNLALIDGRLTPDLYTLVVGTKQTAGDQFAVTLLETAKSYLFQGNLQGVAAQISVGMGQLEYPDGTLTRAHNRLQGAPLIWRTLALNPDPPPLKSKQWSQQWNPFGQCSWPPEDNRIESFTGHIREQAVAMLGADLAKTEKFTTSFKDGVDLRESLRHWHETYKGKHGQKCSIYVKENPPNRGTVEAVVFIFDTPADPAKYSWRATWQAEHHHESTLSFFATPFHQQLVGPGIGQAQYGGALFLYPPRAIPDIWDDPRLEFSKTLEEHLIAAAAMHSQEAHIVVVAPLKPPASWRRSTQHFSRQLVPIPLGRFSGQTIEQLRRFHVLNGHDMRRYAAKFIRR